MPFNILVVEDEKDFREVLVEILSLKGYEASGVGSIKAYKAIESPLHYDFIILDRTLPDGDGLNILATHRKISSIPILILSGLGLVDDRVQGLDADADYYLVKPVVMPELLAIVGRYARQAALLHVTNNECWKLNTSEWILISPEGVTIKLSNSELLFLNCFKDAVGEKISRNVLVTKLGFKPDAYDIRRLESMVSRLRNKIQNGGAAEFPLVTVYGVGYAFNAQLISIGQAN